MENKSFSMITIRLPEDKAKEIKKRLIDLNLTMTDWMNAKIDEELAKPTA